MPQSVVYGKCVASHMEDIQKDICAKEFLAFKECVQKHVSPDVNNAHYLGEKTMVKTLDCIQSFR